MGRRNRRRNQQQQQQQQHSEEEEDEYGGIRGSARSAPSGGDDDALERRYVQKRRRIMKSVHTKSVTKSSSENEADPEGKSDSGDTASDVPRSSSKQTASLPTDDDAKGAKPSQKKQKLSDKSTAVESESKGTAASQEATKQERQRQKNQRRKELRRLKKQAKADERQATVQQQQQEQEKKQRELLKKKEAEEKKKKQLVASQQFVTVRSGVQYMDVQVGRGPVVQERKKIHVEYTLRAKTRYGKVLDSSSNFGFRLGRGEVIEGWDIGMKGMRAGGVRHLIIPKRAGYGNRNIGAGPGADLYFEVKLLQC